MVNVAYPSKGDLSPAARAQRETYWQRMVERWKTSGLPKSRFCKREGISAVSLHAWMRRLAEQEGNSPPQRARESKPRQIQAPSFVPVRVVSPALQPSKPPVVEVLVAGQVIRVQPEFDVETFRRIVSVLEGWPTLDEVSGDRPC